MTQPQILSIDAARYFGLDRPRRLRDPLRIAVTPRSFPPYLDDLQADWVASVAIPAFKLIAARKGSGFGRAFCSIGTGTGLDALGGIEIFDASLVGITDVHSDVVSSARDNILSNLLVPRSVGVLSGIGDLLSPLAEFEPRFDVIYENLPNVPSNESEVLAGDRASSSFFPPRREDVPQAFKDNLLTLHYVALLQAHPFLAPGGVILSMLGARVPLTWFLRMSEVAGYRPSFLTYGWKVQAEALEMLNGHAEWQRRGLGPFHFYRIADLVAAFAGLAPEAAAPDALAIEAALAPHALDAEAALAAHLAGEKIGHTYAVLVSEAEARR